MGSSVPRIYSREMDLDKIKEAVDKIKLKREYLNSQDLVNVGLYVTLAELHHAIHSNFGPKKLPLNKRFAIFAISDILSFIDNLKDKRKMFLDKKGASYLYIMNNTFKDEADKSPRYDYLSTGDNPKPKPDYKSVLMELDNKFNELVSYYNIAVKDFNVVCDKIVELSKLFIDNAS